MANTAAGPQTLEAQLKIRLPEDLGQALSNGALLCQLANHVRPRSVSTIHVPSPAVVSVFFDCAPPALAFGPVGPKHS